MSISLVQWIARARSMQRALDALDATLSHVLLILPSTRNALLLAREVCFGHKCDVIAGPISSDPKWEFGLQLRAPTEIAKAYAGRPELPRTIISFPDQLIGNDLSFTWLPFLGARYSFSVIEALLALRHRPRVFTLRSSALPGEFSLIEVQYSDLLETQARMASLHALMGRLLGPLENELKNPPGDWLASHWLKKKSEAYWRLALREELKDLECLLRLHLLTPGCDQLRTGTAVAAVVARQKYILGAVSP